MINGTTSSGFEFHVPEDLKNDAFFLRSVSRLQNAKQASEVRMEAIFEAVTAVFNNPEEEERFYKFLASKNETGRATVQEVNREITEIIAICGEQDEDVKK